VNDAICELQDVRDRIMNIRDVTPLRAQGVITWN
jgi:ribosomal protein S11